MWVKIPATKMVCSCGTSLGHGQKCLSSCHLLTALNFSFSRLPKYPSLPTSQLGQNPCNQNGLQLWHLARPWTKVLEQLYIYIDKTHILLFLPCFCVLFLLNISLLLESTPAWFTSYLKVFFVRVAWLLKFCQIINDLLAAGVPNP